MLQKTTILVLLLIVCACQSPRQTALLDDKSIEWDAIIATDDGDNHGGFRQAM